MKILSIGGGGLIGSRIEELLNSQYEFIRLGPENGLDITNPSTLDPVKKAEVGSIVFLLAAKTNVDACEADKLLGERGDAWRINVGGTQNIVDACKKNGLKLIYVSTDFVFDGKKPAGQSYSEEDFPHPLNWYATTKYEGEKLVQKSGLPYLILRFAFPYRSAFFAKKDFVQAIMDRFKKNEPVRAIFDQLITPTFVDDIASAVSKLLEENVTGIYHVTGSSFISPFDAAKEIARVFSYDQTLIRKTSLESYFQNRAPRPFNLSLKHDKIARLGVGMRTFKDGLLSLKAQS